MIAKKPIQRRDARGRLNPRYARELLEKARETRNDHDSPEAGHAFLRRATSNDALAEDLGEAFVEAVTSGEGTAGPSSRPAETKSLPWGPTSPTSPPPRASPCRAAPKPSLEAGKAAGLS